jgi:predicted Holliday junction resolvase-like endonuclease
LAYGAVLRANLETEMKAIESDFEQAFQLVETESAKSEEQSQKEEAEAAWHEAVTKQHERVMWRPWERLAPTPPFPE